VRNYRYLKNVVTLKLATHKCTGCGMCTSVCPHVVFEIQEKKAVVIDRDACMECGACVRNCPVEAITVRAGVGCANAIIKGAVKGTAPTCGDSCCDSTPSCC
jgi:NAD-dependent dihydropyrimidine dehydrogenase PreA subunit